MKKINRGLKALSGEYLFSKVENNVRQTNKNGEKIIRSSTGDAVIPLGKSVVKALTEASSEMGTSQGFKGYPPYSGYDFLKNAIASYYLKKKITLLPDEIYVGNGSKSDIADFTDLFGKVKAVLTDPCYPVYSDSAAIAGFDVVYAVGKAKNGFLPLPSDVKRRINKALIYLCSPMNPTGEAYTFRQLSGWVNFALKTHSLILFDSAYEAYISDKSLPRSIFEINGSALCAVEFGSFSKTAGFTGLRCSYTIIPSELYFDGSRVGKLWQRRQSTKFNGVPYIVQKGAETALSPEGSRECRKTTEIYKENARKIRAFFLSREVRCFGGINAPYVWAECPAGLSSEETAEELLRCVSVAVTPGSGFGKNGKGFIRLTGFIKPEEVDDLIERLDVFYSEISRKP